jgi:murein DD-endopeptidase MepM/ murein hydrolase activator NlpD
MFHRGLAAPVVLTLLAALAGCSGNSLLPRLGPAPSPYDRYAAALGDTALADTALVRDWRAASDIAMAQPLTVTLPMRESGYFAADRPAAVAYQIELQRGRRLSVELSVESVEPSQVFVDLFEARAEQAPQRVASLTEGASLTYDVVRDGTYLLRIQPELLRSGRFTIVQRTLASLPFPVTGLTARAVQSEFGAERDAGRREHQGIDIFAPRDTPVLAVADGTAHSGTNGLGGNVVWLRDGRRRQRFYYAHLSRPAFEGAVAVKAGDVVGYIGNTGNARTTAPHLHFGIYQDGAIDPLPFLRADDAAPAPAADAGKWLGELVRVTSARTPFRRAWLARVVGVTPAQLRIELPNRVTGYLGRSDVSLAQTPLRRQVLRAGALIRERPLPAAPHTGAIAVTAAVDVLGEFNGFAFIRERSGSSGWVEATAN